MDAGKRGRWDVKRGMWDLSIPVEKEKVMRKNLLAVLFGIVFALSSVLSAGIARAEEEEADEVEMVSLDQPELTEAEIMQFLGAKLPAVRKALEDMKAKDADGFAEAVEEWGANISAYKTGLEDNPEWAEAALKTATLDFDSQLLASQVAAAKTKADKDALTAKLRAAVSEIFARQLADKENEIKAHEAQIAEIRQSLAQRKADKNKIVEKHVADMIADNDDDEWEW